MKSKFEYEVYKTYPPWSGLTKLKSRRKKQVPNLHDVKLYLKIRKRLNPVSLNSYMDCD